MSVLEELVNEIKSSINDIKNSMRDIKDRLDKVEENELQSYTSEEVCKLLKISKRKLQSLRDERRIDFFQERNTIRYRKKGILKYLEGQQEKPSGRVIDINKRKSA